VEDAGLMVRPLTIGMLGLGFAAGILYFLHHSPWEPERQRNMDMSPDWDEAWERLQQAHAYYLAGDLGHTRLRLMEAMHHADQLPDEQRRDVMVPISALEAQV